MLGPALQSVGNRASLPALKPTGQSAADSPKGSRQVLADVTGHLEPFFTSFRTAAHPERLHSDQQRTSIRRLSLMHWNSVLQRQPFREELRFSSRIANRPQLDEICSTTFSTAYAHLFTCHAFTNTFNYLHVIRKQEECKDWTATVMRFEKTTASSSVSMPALGWTCRCSPPGRWPSRSNPA